MACETTSSEDLLAMAWSRASRSGVVSEAVVDGEATTLADAMDGWLANTRDDVMVEVKAWPKRRRRERNESASSPVCGERFNDAAEGR